MKTISRPARTASADERRRKARFERPPRASHCDYWLRHCEGYRVDAVGGRLGHVEEIRDGDSGCLPSLAIRAGRLGTHLLSVPASEVAFIVPRAKRIWLKTSAQLADSDPREDAVQ
jgi:hypothetical protein